MSQIALPFSHRDAYDPAAFLAAPSNQAALAWLDHAETWPNQRLALHGEPGSGKTHLLRIFAHRAGAAVLDGKDLAAAPIAPITTPLAIDNADQAPAAILHWLNAAAEATKPVLLAARAPPARWQVTLPDLASRLRATAAVAIDPPDDTLLRAVFARLTAERQLRVDESVQDYLLARLPRSCAAMRDAADRLDRLSLAAGSRVTKPLAALLLREVAAAPDEDLPQDEGGVSPGAASLF